MEIKYLRTLIDRMRNDAMKEELESGINTGIVKKKAVNLVGVLRKDGRGEASESDMECESVGGRQEDVDRREFGTAT